MKRNILTFWEVDVAETMQQEEVSSTQWMFSGAKDITKAAIDMSKCREEELELDCLQAELKAIYVQKILRTGTPVTTPQTDTELTRTLAAAVLWRSVVNNCSKPTFRIPEFLAVKTHKKLTTVKAYVCIHKST